jgi:hypothetical protein
VAESGRGAGAKRSECSSVLPDSGTTSIPTYLLEETTAGSRKSVVCGSATGAEPRVRARGLGSPTIEMRLKNGRSLLVAAGFDARHLRALLATVESC